MIIYAVNNNFMNDIAIEDIQEFEADFYIFMRNSHPEVGNDIKNTGKLSDENEQNLRAAIEEFKTRFKNSK